MSTGYYPYRNLVFEGGGVKGVAYGGAVEVLEQSQITPQIERVAGTSAGAITAAMVCLNYTADEFVRLMMGLPFEKLEDGSDLGGPVRLVEHYGWFKGDYFLGLMESYVEANPGDERRTVFINDLGVGTTDFKIADQMKWELIAQGRIATAKYLSQPQQPLPEVKRLLRRA